MREPSAIGLQLVEAGDGLEGGSGDDSRDEMHFSTLHLGLSHGLFLVGLQYTFYKSKLPASLHIAHRIRFLYVGSNT